MKTIVTHNGKFHTDDVFAVATLLLLYPDAQIVRTRDEKLIESADIVVDVGKIYDTAKLRFDHHQIGGAGVRKNGIPYASFGLVWKEFGTKLADAEVAMVIEEKLVMAIDALDNGVSVAASLFEGIREYGISDYLNSYWIDEDTSEEKTLEIFKNVVGVARKLIEREIIKARRIIDESKIVEDIYNNSPDKRLIVLDKSYAWGRILVNKPEPLIVVYPRTDSNNWGVQAVRENLNGFKTRISLPETWAGRSGSELAKVSGVPDAIFCHNARFLAVAESKEGALALAEKALNA